MSLRIKSVFLFFGATLLATTAGADLRGLFGLGSRSAGVAGSDRAIASDAFSVASNPATISQNEKAIVNLAVSTTAHRFPTLPNVVADNVTLGGSATTYGNSDPGVPSQGYFLLGAVTRLGKSSWSFGLNLFAPVDKFIEAKTVDVYRPNYTLYDGNPQKLSLSLGLSKEVLPGFAVGIGGALYYDTAAVIVGRLNNAPQTSTINVGATARPGIAPNVGFSWKLTNHVLAASYLGGRDYRLNSEIKTFINAGFQVPINVTGFSTLYYDPATYNLGYSSSWGRFQFLAAVDYEIWSPYNGSAYKATFTTFAFNQTPVNVAFKDIVIPRVGAVFNLSPSSKLRAGYAYRPTPTPDPSTTVANILDADRHIVAAGLMYDTGTWDGFWPEPFVVDVNVQGHFLQDRRVSKSDPTGIGAPGYTIGGNVIQAGLQISMEL